MTSLSLITISQSDNNLFVPELAVREQQETEELSIYPNPVSEVLIVKGLQGAYHILDLTGNRILKQQRAEQLDLSGLVPGTYFLRTGTGEIKSFVKI